MQLSAAIYIIGTLSLLLQLLSGGAATEQPFRIFHGIYKETEVYDNEMLTINRTNTRPSLTRLQFIAPWPEIIEVSNNHNMTTDFFEWFQATNGTAIIYTFYLDIVEDGSITVHGVTQEHNTDHQVVLHFNVQRDEVPTTTESPPASTTDTPTSSTTTSTTTTLDTTTQTLGIQTEASSGNNRIESSTLITVVVVVVIVALVAYIVTVGVMVIYYRNRLKKLKLKQPNCVDPETPTNQIV